MKPILFNTEMVNAVLEGRKTQTRRAIRNIRAYHMDGTPGNKPMCNPGDVLYVRETWSWLNAMDCGSLCIGPCKQYKGEYGCFVHKASNPNFTDAWNPSIHMPREAARIFLKVKDVRVERLQSITNEQALAEGFEGEPCDHPNMDYIHGCTDCLNTGWILPPMFEFAELWDKTIKPADISRFGWEANPWVWVIEFEKMEGSP